MAPEPPLRDDLARAADAALIAALEASHPVLYSAVCKLAQEGMDRGMLLDRVSRSLVNAQRKQAGLLTEKQVNIAAGLRALIEREVARHDEAQRGNQTAV